MTQEEFSQFVQRVRWSAVRSIRHRVGDHAEDVFQDTVASFLVLDGGGTPDYEKYGRGAFRWVFHKRLHARLANYIRAKEKGVWKLQSPLFERDFEKQLVDGPEDRFVAVDRVKNLRLWGLSTRQLEILDHYYAHGLTQAEIAEVEGISQQAVNQSLKSALAILADESGGMPQGEAEKARWQLQVELAAELEREGREPSELVLALVQRLASARRPFSKDLLSGLELEESFPDPQTGALP